jgi:hypothetical protein
MRAVFRGLTALAGATCLVGSYLAMPIAASAATATPFGSANFAGYASGDELHLGAVTLGTTQLADVEQAFSGATTNSAGLASEFTDPTGPPTGISPPAVIQPAQPSSVKAYGMGSGLEVGVAVPTTEATDLNQLLISGKAQSIAPPISPPVTKQITIPAGLSSIAAGAALVGRSDALYDPNVCPLGQPLSYGLGSASNVTLLPTAAGIINPGTVMTAGSTPSQTANTTSFTYLNANPDGSFGLASQATETVAPLTVNVSTLLKLQITLSGSQDGTAPANPVTLKAVSTGNGTSSVTLTNDNFLTITLNGTALVPPTALAGLTAPRVITLPGLGTITINTLTQSTAGNVATASYTLFGLNLNLAGALPIANLEVGHMIAGARANSSITCTIPMVKISQPPSVQAGNSFIYTIEVPDPAKLGLLACDLTNLKVVDTISSIPAGNAKPTATNTPTFMVTSATPGPPTSAIAQTSPSNATVTFSGLHYTATPPGQTKINPPVVLSITVAVPKNSPAGTIQDTAVATANTSGCNGGITGITNLGGVNGTGIGGSTTLKAPTVTLAAVTPAAGGAASRPAGGAGQPGALPRTGGVGGLWQPGLGVGLLALAGGTFALLRRSRRRLAGS